MICDRCYQSLDVGEHGHGVCPFEPRRDSCFPNVIGDEIVGGFTTDHMTGQPETFYSKSDHRRRVKELGLRIRDEYAPPPGGDRAMNSVRWR